MEGRGDQESHISENMLFDRESHISGNMLFDRERPGPN
jgi:hypothetical protein